MAFCVTLGANSSVFVNDRRLDPQIWRTDQAERGMASGARAVTASEAMAVLSRATSLRHLVVGVIGPRDASAAQISTAREVGAALAGFGVTVICGGRSGVMEAVSQGVAEAGGLVIGILPGSSPEEANRFVGIPLPTGLGEARNMIIAKSARALVAVGGSYGTLSEVAYGLHFGKAVIGLEDAAEVDGVQHAASVDAAVDLAMEALLAAAASSVERPAA